MRKYFLCAGMLLIAGCSSPESQINNALLDAGLSKPMASCMAARMADQLSYSQLWKLRSLKNLRNADAKTMSIEEFMKNSKSLQDPEILKVITQSGIVCAFSG
jgi:uncharacterized lipoprotein YajG